ncbi:oligosaccharide flippase family protein [Deinococcus sp. YIM 134068]|uniref:oligosaccharide flippase family protein n=1 Tax=Deinococcus lichenicola TaxID=3118910 RepID=UPI002F934803
MQIRGSKRYFYIFAQFAGTLTARVYTAASMFAISIVSARLLTVESRGELAMYLNLFNIISLFVGLSLWDVVFHKKMMQVEADKIWYSSLIIFPICMFAGVVFSFMILEDVNLINRIGASLGISLAAGMQVVEFVARSVSIRGSKLNNYNFASIVGRTVTLVLTFASLAVARSPFHVVLSIACGLIIIILMSVQSSASELFLKMKWGDFISMLKYALPIHMGLVAAATMSQLDQLIIGISSSKVELALYQVAAQVLISISILPQTISSMTYSSLSTSQTDGRNIIAFALGMSIVIAGIFCLTLTYFSNNIIYIIFGGEYSAASRYLSVLSFSSFGIVSMALFAPLWVTSGAVRINSLITGLVSVLFLSANILIVPNYGAMGASYVSACSYSIIFIFNMVYWYRIWAGGGIK